MHTSFPVVSPLDEAMPVQATAAPIAIPSLSARCAKRAFDLIGALFSLVFLSPVLLVIVLLQWFTSGGPAFFRQERIGKNGRPFKILKFSDRWLLAAPSPRRIAAIVERVDR